MSYGRSRHSHHSITTPPPAIVSHSLNFSNGNNNGNNNNNDNNNESGWNCSECTYLNAAHKPRCDMCLTPKPKSISNNNNNNNNNLGNNSPISPHRNNGNKKGIKFTTSFHDSPISPNSPSFSSASRNYSSYNKANNNNNAQNEHEQGKVPQGSILPENISWNPKKPASEQTIFERWMIAQIERQSGQQPAICVKNNVLLTNLRRVRAPTTHRTIQQQIDNNTNAFAHSNQLDAGDFTDDEEEELSGMYPQNSPRSQGSANGNYSFTPTPSDTDDENHLAMSYTPKASKQNSTQSHKDVFNNINHRNKRPPLHNSKPLTKPKNGLSFDNVNNHKNNLGSNGRSLPRTLSTDDATSFTYNHKKLLNQRRRKKTNRRNQTVSQLWFKAQQQLKQGRNPLILAKYNIKLQNIRQHNPRFKDYQRRKSHHEKAATYLQVTGDKIHTNHRNQIDHDDDDFSDTENETSQPSTPNTPNTPNTPHSQQNSYID